MFGFYDNFSSFSPGNLVGQSAWTQLGSVSSSPMQIAGGQAGFTGGLTNSGQTAYKNFSLTNETVFYGLTLTVTNTPTTNTATYFVTMYSSSNATGNASFRLAAGSPNSAKTNFVLGVKVTPAANDPFAFGTGAKGLSYGTQYRVIVEAVGGGGSNVIVYVNPTSGTLGAQTPYTNNAVATGITTVGSVAIAQLGSSTTPSAGGLIGKFVVGDNFAAVYTDLLGIAPPTASFVASPTIGAAPLSVTFTDTSTGNITNWSWSFGDGGTTNISTNSVLYTYNAAGVYSVTEVVSGLGGSSTDAVANLISVYDPFAWWQQAYGITNCALCAGNASYTGDGMSNTNKFMTGFNPTNAAAYLHIIGIASTNTTDINVIYLGANGDTTWSPGIASRTNVLEFTAGMADGSYSSNNFASTGQTNILSGGNGTGIVTNMVDAGGATNTPSRYYRIRVLVP